MSANIKKSNSTKEIIYNGNKIIKYNDGYMAYYFDNNDCNGDIQSKSFKSLYKAKCFLNKLKY